MTRRHSRPVELWWQLLGLAVGVAIAVALMWWFGWL